MRQILAALLLTLGLASPALAAVCSPTPALPDTERRSEYIISGSTGPLNVGFQLYGDGVDFAQWVQVWVNGVQRIFNDPSFGWTLTSPTGPLANLCRPITDAQITFTAPQTGTIEIVGARRPRRTSQVSENAGVTARTFNQVISDMEAQQREDWDMRSRLFLAGPGQTGGIISGATGVFGPGSSTDKGIARFLGTTGGVIQNSSATISDAGTLLIAPTPATTAQGLTLTQSTPTTGTVAGPFALNLFNITDGIKVTGSGSDSTGNNNVGNVGFRVNTLFAGTGLAGSTAPLIGGLYTATVTTTSAIPDVTGLAATAYTNVAMSSNGYLEGMNAVAQVGPTGVANILNGLDVTAFIQAGGTANYRFGISVLTTGAVNGTINDAAIVFNANTTTKFNNVFLFSNFSGQPPIGASSNVFSADTAYTVANFASLANMTVTGNILRFPSAKLQGDGGLALGSGGATVSAGSLVATGSVVANGALGSGGPGLGNGLLSLGGNTSGGINFTANATGSLVTVSQAMTVAGALSANGTLGSGGVGLGNGTLSLGGNTSGGWNLTASATGATATATGNFSAAGLISANGALGSGGAGLGTGSLVLAGTTSGSVTQTVQSVAGSPTVTWGTGSGTPPVTASAPLGITAATGNITCATCAITTTTLAKVKVQKFTANGTYTPSAGIINAIIECIGGGGAGGGAKGTTGNYYGAGGGGSGSYSRAYVTAATIGGSQTVTIGAGGTAGTAGENNGGNGVDTSVGTLCVGKGGSGGLYGSVNQVGAGGAGGVAGTGDLTTTGTVGSAGLYSTITSVAFPSGSGASSAFGGGAPGIQTTSTTCGTGTSAVANTGGGGSGAICNQANTLTAAGGVGGSGMVVVTEFTNQ